MNFNFQFLCVDLNTRLEELIKRIGEKSQESLETNIERLVDILDQEIATKKDFILNSLISKLVLSDPDLPGSDLPGKIIYPEHPGKSRYLAECWANFITAGYARVTMG